MSMDKRYQVFLSSTYSDLKEERQAVLQALMEMDCIPAGMELFPAADEEQWTFIQKVIDDCDYYVLVLGGRYGTLTPEGVSYTEKEFDYAVERGIKVIALVHGEVSKLQFEKVEANPDARELLQTFREKVTTGRLVKFWTEAKELPGLVALSLQRTIKMYPAQGWVRSGSLATADAVQKVNQLQDRVRELEEALRKSVGATKIDMATLASGNDTFSIMVKWTENSYRLGRQDYEQTLKPTWNDILSVLGPEVLAPTNMARARIALSEGLAHRNSISKHARIHEDDFHTIAHHLAALGLVKIYSGDVVGGGVAVFMQLTESGQAQVSRLRSVPKTEAKA
jgi:hypothetical protein